MLTVNRSMSPMDNPGFKRLFRPGNLTIGVFFPIEAFSGDRPTMEGQVELAQAAEEGGFDALWFRDVPLRDPDFGDVGQIFDPWVYLGYIAAQTRNIALGTAAIIMPLRHPLHTAKAAASVDRLSGGRLVMGIASGDRPREFPAFGQDLSVRGETFRESVRVFRQALSTEFPTIVSRTGEMVGVDLVPKPVASEIPILVTGCSQQDLEWIAENTHGWISYPRNPDMQSALVRSWRDAVARKRPGAFRPFAQSLYIDLASDPDAAPVPIHLGYRLGRRSLLALLATLRHVGVNHVILNLKYGQRHAGDVLKELSAEVLPAVKESSMRVPVAVGK